MNGILNYFKLVKFSHTIFALPFALVGFFMGLYDVDFFFSLKILLLILVCMVSARNSAMGFNRWLDKRIDLKNERTKDRVIPAGIVKPSSALIFTIVNALIFVVSTYFINKLTFMLSPVVLLVILGYSYTKRFTFLSHFILGLGLSFAPIGAYISVTGSFSLVPILLSLAVLMWVSGFDILYSTQDYEFDKKNKLFSVPVAFGIKGALVISIIVHLVSIVFIVTTAIVGNYSFLYWVGVIIYVCFIIFQHSIVKVNDLSRINKAFFFSNGMASLTYAIFAILGILLSWF
ncbi:MAG: putative 4-hydroxybenzoate polyprenyltransferase [Lentimicrobiaceae bacterium]|nr:putative 4-hydroxybenzoate polyprenyltransferase [Lentimicrobiaceae bacterium]